VKNKGYKGLVSSPEKMKKRILTELCRIAFANIEEYVSFEKDENGQVVCICADPEKCDMAAVAEVSLSKSGLKLKTYNKEVALGRLGSYLGMWREKPEEDVEDLNAIKEILAEEA